MKPFCFLFLVFCLSVSAQEAEKEKRSFIYNSFKLDKDADEVNQAYLKLDVSTPLKYNEHHDETDPQTGEKGYWFLPDGINARVGIGYNYDDLLTVGGATGIDWKAFQKIVTVPIFAETRLSPKVGEETRIYLTAGYGHAFALGRGNLNGNFQKYSLGVGNDEGSYFFLELNYYGFPIQDFHSFATINLGISFQLI